MKTSSVVKVCSVKSKCKLIALVSSDIYEKGSMLVTADDKKKLGQGKEVSGCVVVSMLQNDFLGFANYEKAL